MFTNVLQSPNRPRGNTSFCANFVKFGRPEVGEIARYLMDQKKQKNSALPPEAASAQIAPKICQIVIALDTILADHNRKKPKVNILAYTNIILGNSNVLLAFNLI